MMSFSFWGELSLYGHDTPIQFVVEHLSAQFLSMLCISQALLQAFLAT